MDKRAHKITIAITQKQDTKLGKIAKRERRAKATLLYNVVCDYLRKDK